jgi:hypothetical protein
VDADMQATMGKSPAQTAARDERELLRGIKA